MKTNAQRWLAAIVESSDDAIVGKRLDGTIVSWNESAQRMFGYTAKEIIGESVLKLFPPELMHTESEIVSRLAKGQSVDHYETYRVRKDGSRIDVSLSVSPIRNGRKKIVGAAKIARDITEAKRMRDHLRMLSDQLQDQATELEQQLEETTTMGIELEHSNLELSEALLEARQARADAEKSQAEAERANRAKSEFLAMMSHEFRTPLNAISGYADLMDAGIAGPLPDAYRDYVARIRKSQQHLLELISRVLDFSKLEAGRVEMRREPIPVAELFAGLQDMVGPQALSKGVVLEIHRPDDGVRVLVDRERALQILLNLVGNAIKFTPSGGNIAVNAIVAHDAVTIQVRDTGPGVRTPDVDRIFEPFVQGEPSLTRAHQGAGLGLAISRELARAMDGEVTLESTSPSGSTFVLWLERAT